MDKPKKARKGRPFDVHGKMMRLARSVAKRCSENHDGEKCFSLPTFLATLESELKANDKITGRFGEFQMSEHQMARYAWCCLALEGGDSPSGTLPKNTFQGLPILD